MCSAVEAFTSSVQLVRPMCRHDNEYYTPDNNASLHCGGSSIPVGKIYGEHGLEKGSTSNPMPTDDAMVAWAKQNLGMA